MDSFIDIHSHFLPGIDDGAKKIENSMKMLHIAHESGTKMIILTPHNKPMHHNASPDTIRELAKKMQMDISKEGIDITLYTGNEIYYRSDILELLETGKVCTMADTSYILTEFNPMDDYDYIRKAVYKITSGGYQPILAHVERYINVCAEVIRVEELIKMGAYIQVNAGSIMGQYGFRTKNFTRRLLNQRLVHFVASDAHDEDSRGPQLKKCADYICKRYGEEYAATLLYENPSRMIAGEDI